LEMDIQIGDDWRRTHCSPGRIVPKSCRKFLSKKPT